MIHLFPSPAVPATSPDLSMSRLLLPPSVAPDTNEENKFKELVSKLAASAVKSRRLLNIFVLHEIGTCKELVAILRSTNIIPATISLEDFVPHLKTHLKTLFEPDERGKLPLTLDADIGIVWRIFRDATVIVGESFTMDEVSRRLSVIAVLTKGLLAVKPNVPGLANFNDNTLSLSQDGTYLHCGLDGKQLSLCAKNLPNITRHFKEEHGVVKRPSDAEGARRKKARRTSTSSAASQSSATSPNSSASSASSASSDSSVDSPTIPTAVAPANNSGDRPAGSQLSDDFELDYLSKTLLDFSDPRSSGATNGPAHASSTSSPMHFF